MRLLVALATVCLLSACKLSLDATLAPLDCGDSYSRHGSSCGGLAGPIVIVIGPSRQYADAGDALCYQVSPVAASVKVGESYTFQNSTNSNITVQGSDRSTWTTVSPGQTSSALSFSAAGSYSFGVQGCSGISGTPYYGQLNVAP